MGKDKKFLDAVHGYISVPDNICNKIIDTKNFQRLRRIEQTSSRSLFPCAHHDRFIHSLGVFHIGQKIATSVCSQLPDCAGIKQSYLLACLLHDCGHAPFSHSLEHLFGTTEYLFDIYKQKLNNRGIDEKIDIVDINYLDTKQHEIISAYLCLTVYYESIIELGGNPALIGRMIIGCPYEDKNKSLENCFISLLHGEVIDADRLDYVCRDKWASGYLSSSVDIDRLISSMKIKHENKKYIITYGKSALNEIQAVMDSRNFQQIWVFKHHQIVYEQMLLQESVKELVKVVSPQDPNNTKTLFNYKSFEELTQVNENVSIFLPSDDDIVHLMKTHKDNIPHLEEWLSREYKHIPLWKSQAEFIALFKDYGGKKLLERADDFFKTIEELINEEIKGKCISLNANPSLKHITEGQIFIDINGIVIDFSELNMISYNDIYIDQQFKYIFIPIESQDRKSNLIEKIKSIFPFSLSSKEENREK
ncbi:HD domain-containing protein [Bacteroidales bacterium OttesenSCG-928-I14]|nr:HD domain-containing protein [Bacteroidales bacterium OttesenSCG-928-I14]